MQVESMLRSLDRFCGVSGQKVSRDKTKVCFSKKVHVTRAIDMSNLMGVSLTGDLGKYLGIPLLHRRASAATFAPLMEKASRRLAGWMRGCLNMAGRSTLIKAVFAALPTYYMQTILLPKGIIRELDKTSRSFLWGEREGERKLHLLSWEQVV